MRTTHSRCALGLIGALSILIPSSPALSAGPPSARQSVFSPQFCVSPKNICVPTSCRCRFEGILRDDHGVPIPNFPASQVVLDFTACGSPSTRPLDRISADEDSDANGLVYWEVGLHFGGSDPCEVLVRVQNQVYAVVPAHQGLPDPEIDGGLRSPDMNGDGLVAIQDLAVFQQEFMNSGPRVDYHGDVAMPCDGVTSIVDLGWFQCHFTTVCP